MKNIKSILWRKINKSTYETLTGISKGQYDIRLGNMNFEDFIDGLPRYDSTDLGGYKISLPICEYLDSDPTKSIAKQNIILRYMGNSSARKDWNIPSQRPDTTYPLRSPNRRLPTALPSKSYLYIVRTVDNLFHARLVLDNEFENLPEIIKCEMLKKECGCLNMKSLNVSSEAKKIYNKLIKEHNVLLYGPPGTGKTTLMQEVLRIFNNGGTNIKFDESKESDCLNTEKEQCFNNKSIWTTFHQSYSYEEFILGLTTDNSGEKLLNINPKPGILLELSEFARIKTNRSLLVIDELNRGNVSRIFGEFITLIEPDKRLSENGNETETTVKIRLPHVKFGEKISFKVEEGEFTLTNPFTMPNKIYTLASMNSVDKSIVPLDSALRRRFFRYDIFPNLDLLAKKLNIDSQNTSIVQYDDISKYSIDDIKKLSWKLLDTLNKKITIFLGKDFTLGHSYVWKLTNKFENVDEALDELINSFTEQIYPQLEEIFKGRLIQLQYILMLNQKNTKTKIFDLIEPSEEEFDLGATTSITLNSSNFSGINALKWFIKISEIEEIPYIEEPISEALNTSSTTEETNE